MPELMGFCIESMPSSIEILEPDTLTMTAKDLTDIFNDLQAKLHNISLSIKNVSAQNLILEQNTQILATNLVGIALKGVSLSKEELAKITGIPIDKMDNFLKSLVEQKRIVQSGNLYSRKWF
jgi:predicted transcriptional regulator